MGRLSEKAKLRYERLEADDPAACYYCHKTSFIMMDDTTPSHKISDEMQSLFEGAWSIARCCNTCWAKIQHNNLVKQARGYGDRAGLMTVDQKHQLISGIDPGYGKSEVQGKMYIYKGKMILPVGCGIDEEGSIFVNTKRFPPEEVAALQGVMAMKFLGMPNEAIEITLGITIVGGDIETTLNAAKTDQYKMMLGLIDDPDHGKGF